MNRPETKSSFRHEVKAAFPSLLFDRPVGVCRAGVEAGRLFVVEQSDGLRF